MDLGSRSPIELVVDHIAAAVGKAWDRAREEQAPVGDAQESEFLRIALALFNSYVIELRENIEEANALPDILERRRLRSEAWTNFRVGFNKLYSLEERSGTRKRIF
jgi:hypothetical protein